MWFAAGSFALLTISNPLSDQYAAAGFQDGRSHSFSLDDVSSVDPFSGMLQVRHVDITLDGVGPSIEVARYYNSSTLREVNGGAPILRPRNLMANNWSFHPGYVLSTGSTENCDIPISHPAPQTIPSMILPDGRREELYQPPTSSNISHNYITKKGWVANCLPGLYAGYSVIDQSGTVYRFDRRATIDFDPYTNTFRLGYLLTSVSDTHGNTIQYNYNPGPSSLEELTSITASDGRRIDFVYETVGAARRLRQAIAFRGSAEVERWTYLYQAVPGFPSYSHLTGVVGPEGYTWTYTYYTTGPGLRDMQSITGPYGATKSFEYSLKNTPPVVGIGPTVAVSRATISGPDLPSSTWSYTYTFDPFPSWYDQTTVTTPDRVETHVFCGERGAQAATQDPENCGQQIGSLQSLEIHDRSGALLQTTRYSWNQIPISDQQLLLRWLPSFTSSPVALRNLETTVERDGSTYTIQQSEFDLDALRPTLVTEYRNGNLQQGRQTESLLYKDLTAWVFGVAHTHVNDRIVDGVDTFSAGTTRTFNTDGTIATETHGGVTNTFGYTSTGLLSTSTNLGTGGLMNIVDFDHGLPKTVQAVGRGATGPPPIRWTGVGADAAVLDRPGHRQRGPPEAPHADSHRLYALHGLPPVWWTSDKGLQSLEIHRWEREDDTAKRSKRTPFASCGPVAPARWPTLLPSSA